MNYLSIKKKIAKKKKKQENAKISVFAGLIHFKLIIIIIIFWFIFFSVIIIIIISVIVFHDVSAVAIFPFIFSLVWYQFN